MKRFPLFVLFITMVLLAQANPVGVNQARAIGARFLYANLAMKADNPSELQLVTTYRTENDNAAFYIFNTSSGFVIVSADDSATPILGYSNEGVFWENDIPVQMEGYLQHFVEQIQYGIDNHLTADKTIARQWELVQSTGEITETKGVTGVEPLLTDSWGQGCYYNTLCPTDATATNYCGHVVTGCVATSFAQIMHYWGYPTSGTGSHTYTPTGYPQQTANFGATSYQWSDMPNSLSSSSSSTQVNAVATLMWHCGVAVEMMYGPNGSGAYSEYVATSLVNYFRYSTDLTGIYKNSYSNAQWLNLIKGSLDLGRPVHYSGNDGTGESGHAFVCDGYDNNNYLHFNWGWNGNHNNYFALDALTPSSYNFSYYNYAIINIHPNDNPGTTYQVSVTVNPATGGTVTGAGTYYEGDLCTLSAVPSQGFGFLNWTTTSGTVVSTSPSYTFTVTGDVSYVAHFNAVNVGYGELDYTYYDWQSNSGARTWTHVWPDGKVNFAYTMATSPSFSDRGTGIGTYDVFNDEWIPSYGRVENEKTGFGSIAQYGVNGLVVAAHTATECCVYIIPDKDNYTPGTIARVGTLDSTNDPTWPNVMTSGPDRNIIHVVALGYSDNRCYYYRSQDGGATWDKQNEILPYMTAEYCEHFNSNCCYWMETTEDNCLALVVNNPWSDGMVLYSYDDGETWERKVFYQHPNPHGDFTGGWFFYPRWTSCQWDSQHHLHVLYEFMATTGEPGSGSFYPAIGGVAYWNETMPYNVGGTTQSSIAGNLTPGQPFVMDSAYTRTDIYASWWLWSDASHEMWPEYVGYLTPLTDDGYPENPYSSSYFNIDDRSLHGAYNSGVCGFPVLCMVPGTDEIVALWSAMDENHTDANDNFYYKLFARYSGDNGLTWSAMIPLTNEAIWNYAEFVYNQAVVVGRKLIIASQVDGQTGTYVQSDDSDGSDNYYQGFVFDIDDLFSMGPTPQYTITVAADPANAGVVSGGGTYYSGNTCTLSAMPNEGYLFDSWTKNGNIVSTNPEFSFIATEDASFVAHFSDQIFTITASALPAEGGVVTGGGSFHTGEVCTLTATPNAGYGFFVWHQDGGAVSSNPTFSFSVVENAHFVAVFDEIIENYVITVMADPIEGGVVSGGGTFNAGNVCTLSAVPNTGYNFVNWTKNGNFVSASPSFSFNVMENADYVAHFEMQTFTVGVNASPSEGGVVSGAGTYTYGSTATVTVTPNQNYVLVNWTDYGTEVSTESSFSFVVTENHQLTANLDFVDAVEQWEEGYVNVYPNPVNDKLTIEVVEPVRQFEVYSIDGTRIYSAANICEKILEIDVKHLPLGNYLIRLTTDNTMLTRRFVKQ